MKKLNLIFTDPDGNSFTNSNICAHCSYFAANHFIIDSGDCYSPLNSHPANTTPIETCHKWKERTDASKIIDINSLRMNAEIVPEKFSFTDEENY